MPHICLHPPYYFQGRRKRVDCTRDAWVRCWTLEAKWCMLREHAIVLSRTKAEEWLYRRSWQCHVSCVFLCFLDIKLLVSTCLSWVFLESTPEPRPWLAEAKCFHAFVIEGLLSVMNMMAAGQETPKWTVNILLGKNVTFEESELFVFGALIFIRCGSVRAMY